MRTLIAAVILLMIPSIEPVAQYPEVAGRFILAVLMFAGIVLCILQDLKEAWRD